MFLIPLGAFGAARGCAAKSWPTVQGSIVGNEIRVGRQEAHNVVVPSYSPEIKYTYEVNGIQFKSKKITSSIFGTVFPRYESAKAQLRKYPRGRKVDVSYHPKRNQVSVLEPGIPTADKLLLLFGFLSLFLGYILRNEKVIRYGSE